MRFIPICAECPKQASPHFLYPFRTILPPYVFYADRYGQLSDNKYSQQPIFRHQYTIPENWERIFAVTMFIRNV